MTYFNEFGQARLGWNVGTPSGGGGSTVDTDAQAFITAASITDSTQQSAINTLVTQLKTYGIWTKMKAIYPFVGGTAEQHRFNLKDPRALDSAFYITFNGGMLHSNLGIVPNGTTAYADTKFNPTGNLSVNNAHISSYINDFGSGVLIGSDQTWRFWMSPRFGASNDRATLFINESTFNYFPSSTNKGLWLGSRLTSTTSKMYNNGNLFRDTNYGSVALENGKIFIAARALSSTTADSFFNKPISFSSIGDGLTDAEAANFYTAVQTFQTTLGRHVGVPIVADTDAQAFLNAAVITNQTQANAINTLVTDLKSANIWTKMKAIYPFVGGTATTHKFNLKDPRDLDAAYRLVFNGGWTHSATGVLPNGTTAYANTYLVPSTSLSQNSTHISYYSRTNNVSGGVDFGTWNASATNQLAVLIKDTDGKTYFRINRTVSTPLSSLSIADSRLFYVMNRTSSSQEILFTNTTKNTFNYSSTGLANYSMYLGAINNVGTPLYYGTKESAFASIGDGLTDAEATAFYNAVQAYQTTLGRQI